jgi:tetratricopeptide (TPR) repeat protein
MLQTIVIALAFLLGALPIHAQQKPANAEAALDAALQAYGAGHLDQAISRLRVAHAAAPANPQVRLYLSLFLYEKAKDSLEAQRLMESVLKGFPSNTDLQLRLLDSYLTTGNTAKSGALIEALQGRMSVDSRFAFNVIYALINHGQIAAAQKEIAKVSNSLQGEVLFIGGMIAFGSEQKAQALDLFQSANQRGFPPPDSAQMLTLAQAYFRMGELPLAARSYEAYFEHHPNAPALHHFQLGLSYYGYADFDRALEQMNRVRETAPRTPEVNLYIGSILVELKKTEEARPFFQAELKNNPESYKAISKLAYLDYLAGNDAACRQWLDQSVSKNPKWFETQMIYGLLYNRLGEYEKAAQSLEACLREEPEYPKAHFQLSIAYRRLGNEEKAKQYQESYDRLQNALIERAQKALGMANKPPEK